MVSRNSRGSARLISRWDFISVAIATVISLATLKLLCIIFLFVKDHKYIGAWERFSRYTNAYIEHVTRSGAACRYVDTLFPHPYLDFVHHANPSCGISTTHRLGL